MFSENEDWYWVDRPTLKGKGIRGHLGEVIKLAFQIKSKKQLKAPDGAYQWARARRSSSPGGRRCRSRPSGRRPSALSPAPAAPKLLKTTAAPMRYSCHARRTDCSEFEMKCVFMGGGPQQRTQSIISNYVFSIIVENMTFCNS